ncbi:hypothetical protein CFC21_044668 [Triticum aestivum]|uniref:Uncharacterized protein n=2 Tax=Triticum aestivum TaxID=4565 RepID=A0A3B6G1P9_WHEAT|nr:hypothetical protein CFC21_044668 [Triticum aestivum]
MACAIHLVALFTLIQLYSLGPSTSHAHGATASSVCRTDQAAALLQLKQSFIFDYSTTTLPSWEPGTDCCQWEGVGCDDGVSDDGGGVTVLDLRGCSFYSYGLHAVVFNLTSLRYLDLSMNDFGGTRIPPAGFEKLTKLTHLKLSCSGLYGQIPIAIGKLTNLVTLDFSDEHNIDVSYTSPSYSAFLSGYNKLLLRGPSLETLLANLTNLRELYLDGVDISSSGEEWCNGLGKVVPYLQVLSMADCHLQGPIHSSLSNLRSLTTVNVHDNEISGVVPEFFTDFLNLSVLQLADNSFSGWFPQTIFQLKNIRVLDVSGNSQLSGHLPEFPNGSSFETLNLQSTNFSGIKMSSFSNILSLRELGFDGRSIFVDHTDLLFNKLNSLQNLQLSFAQFSGELRPFFLWISSLKNLTSLGLSQFSWGLGPFFSCISSLKNLASLQLYDCSSSNIIPTMIGNLTNLKILEIRFGFTGQIPPSIGNLNKLTSLTISACGFSGAVPSSIANLTKLRSMEISENSLSGQIPTYIGHLSQLMLLTFAGCRFSGKIPSVITNLTQLIYVDLSENNLRGEIPTSLFASPAMFWLDLSSNQLSGPIKEFGGLKNLMLLDLSSNNLTSSVHLSSLWKLRKLDYLGLSKNKLSILDGEGSKPMVPLLPKLLIVGFASCNMTTIPRFLMHVNHIQMLDLPSNKIHGSIPKWLWQRWDDSLTSLNLSHNIFKDMQLTSYVLPYNYLESLDLSSNMLHGQIPMPNLLTTANTYPIFLDYSNNRFSSVMSNFTTYLRQTSYLKLSRNNISGHIPHSVCDLSNLEVLDLSYNNFSGILPSCLVEESNLGVLNLRENHLEGTLPYRVGKHCNLKTIDVHGNKIQGQLPRSLSNCAALEVLDIGNNHIVDTFPSWLGRLSDLRIVVLGSNLFYGSLTYPKRDRKSREYFSKLQIIDIASNNFSGNLDPQWFGRFTSMMANSSETGNILGNQIYYGDYHDTIAITYKGQYVTFEEVLTTLTAIDFSNNALEGDIPESVASLVSLHILNMSHNAFTGRIPPQIGEMRQLESLDLSWNKLSGEIPQELTNLTFLSTLNLSGNRLDGRIPQSRQFATFENTSYEGNAELCGPPLCKPCGNSSNPNEAQVSISKDHVDVILFLFAGVGFGVGFAAGILLKWGKIRKWFRVV